MKLNIDLPLKALSQNNIERSASVNHRYKTREATLFAKAVACELANHEGIEAFRNHFNPDTHAIRASYVFFFNHTEMFTKQAKGNRRLSAKIGDVDNRIKFTHDCLFKGIGIDDRFVFEIHAVKHPSMGKGRILAEFEIVSLNDIEEYKEYLTK